MIKTRRFKRHDIAPGSFVSLVPLIDVLLQLIVFLLVMSAWSRANTVELTLPDSTSRVQQADQQAMVVTYQIQNGKPSITLNGQAVLNLDALPVALKALATPKEQSAVTVRIEKTVPYQDVISVMDVLRDSGFPKFSLLTLDTIKRAK